MKRIATGFLAGCLFALGLSLSGMTLPTRVIGFLDFFGNWDPSLAFVMGGALSVFAPSFYFSKRMKAPLTGGKFDLPTKTRITPQLITGAAIFGLGWAVAGFCPGTVLASLPTLEPAAIAVTLGILSGIVATRLVQTRLDKRVETVPAADF